MADGKLVASQDVLPGTFEMEFYYIRSLDDLEEGTFGVSNQNTNNASWLRIYHMAFVLYRDYALMQRDTVWVTVKVIMTDFSVPNLRA